MSEIKVGSIILIRKPSSGYRAWYVTACRLGGLGEESMFEIIPLDLEPGDPDLCQVPVSILGSCMGLEVIDGDWFRSNFLNAAGSGGAAHGGQR